MKSMSERRSRSIVLVVSDLHFTNGRDPATQRWSVTEDFFWDDEFRDFLRYFGRGGACTLVVNGDWLDFMQVLTLPSPEEREQYGIPVRDVSRLYGLRCSQQAAEFQVERIMDGHPVFFQSVAEFLAAGNTMKVLKGNHDIQLCWPGVQGRIVRRLAALVPRRRRSAVMDGVEFLPWCYLVPGLVYVEHGNQFEEACAFRNFLIPELPSKTPERNRYLELDLASLLVRYLTNRVEPVNPLADNVRPLSDFYLMLAKKNPVFALRTFGTALRYVLKACAKAAQMRTGRARAAWRRIDAKNLEAIAAEAHRFSGDNRTLSAKLSAAFPRLYGSTPTPILEQGPARFLWSVARRPLRWALWLVPLYVLTFLPGVARWILRTVDAMEWKGGSDVVHVLDSLNLLSIGLFVLVLGLTLLALRILSRRRPRQAGSTSVPDVSMAMRNYADSIAQELQVRYVSFGHTHYADTAPLANGGRYFNTGTWMGVLESREQLYREVHQFTFLKIEGEDAELLRWNPDRRAPQPVIVMDLDPG